MSSEGIQLYFTDYTFVVRNHVLIIGVEKFGKLNMGGTGDIYPPVVTNN